MILNKDFQQRSFIQNNNYKLNIEVSPYVYNNVLKPFTCKLDLSLELTKKKIIPSINVDLSSVKTTGKELARYERLILTPVEALLMEANKQKKPNNTSRQLSFYKYNDAKELDVKKSLETYNKSRLFESEKMVDTLKLSIKDRVLQEYVFYLAMDLSGDLIDMSLNETDNNNSIKWLKDVSDLLNADVGTGISETSDLQTLYGQMKPDGSQFYKDAMIFRLMVDKYNNTKVNGLEKIGNEKIRCATQMLNPPATGVVSEDLKLVITGFMTLMSQISERDWDTIMRPDLDSFIDQVRGWPDLQKASTAAQYDGSWNEFTEFSRTTFALPANATTTDTSGCPDLIGQDVSGRLFFHPSSLPSLLFAIHVARYGETCGMHHDTLDIVKSFDFYGEERFPTNIQQLVKDLYKNDLKHHSMQVHVNPWSIENGVPNANDRGRVGDVGNMDSRLLRQLVRPTAGMNDMLSLIREHNPKTGLAAADYLENYMTFSSIERDYYNLYTRSYKRYGYNTNLDEDKDGDGIIAGIKTILTDYRAGANDISLLLYGSKPENMNFVDNKVDMINFYKGSDRKGTLKKYFVLQTSSTSTIRYTPLSVFMNSSDFSGSVFSQCSAYSTTSVNAHMFDNSAVNDVSNLLNQIKPADANYRAKDGSGTFLNVLENTDVTKSIGIDTPKEGRYTYVTINGKELRETSYSIDIMCDVSELAFIQDNGNSFACAKSDVSNSEQWFHNYHPLQYQEIRGLWRQSGGKIISERNNYFNLVDSTNIATKTKELRDGVEGGYDDDDIVPRLNLVREKSVVYHRIGSRVYMSVNCEDINYEDYDNQVNKFAPLPPITLAINNDPVCTKTYTFGAYLIERLNTLFTVVNKNSVSTKNVLKFIRPGSSEFQRASTNTMTDTSGIALSFTLTGLDIPNVFTAATAAADSSGVPFAANWGSSSTIGSPAWGNSFAAALDIKFDVCGTKANAWTGKIQVNKSHSKYINLSVADQGLVDTAITSWTTGTDTSLGLYYLDSSSGTVKVHGSDMSENFDGSGNKRYLRRNYSDASSQILGHDDAANPLSISGFRFVKDYSGVAITTDMSTNKMFRDIVYTKIQGLNFPIGDAFSPWVSSGSKVDQTFTNNTTGVLNSIQCENGDKEYKYAYETGKIPKGLSVDYSGVIKFMDSGDVSRAFAYAKLSKKDSLESVSNVDWAFSMDSSRNAYWPAAVNVGDASNAETVASGSSWTMVKGCTNDSSKSASIPLGTIYGGDANIQAMWGAGVNPGTKSLTINEGLTNTKKIYPTKSLDMVTELGVSQWSTTYLKLDMIGQHEKGELVYVGITNDIICVNNKWVTVNDKPCLAILQVNEEQSKTQTKTPGMGWSNNDTTKGYAYNKQIDITPNSATSKGFQPVTTVWSKYNSETLVTHNNVDSNPEFRLCVPAQTELFNATVKTLTRMITIELRTISVNSPTVKRTVKHTIVLHANQTPYSPKTTVEALDYKLRLNRDDLNKKVKFAGTTTKLVNSGESLVTKQTITDPDNTKLISVIKKQSLGLIPKYIIAPSATMINNNNNMEWQLDGGLAKYGFNAGLYATQNNKTMPDSNAPLQKRDVTLLHVDSYEGQSGPENTLLRFCFDNQIKNKRKITKIKITPLFNRIIEFDNYHDTDKTVSNPATSNSTYDIGTNEYNKEIDLGVYSDNKVHRFIPANTNYDLQVLPNSETDTLSYEACLFRKKPVSYEDWICKGYTDDVTKKAYNEIVSVSVTYENTKLNQENYKKSEQFIIFVNHKDKKEIQWRGKQNERAHYVAVKDGQKSADIGELFTNYAPMIPAPSGDGLVKASLTDASYNIIGYWDDDNNLYYDMSCLSATGLEKIGKIAEENGVPSSKIHGMYSNQSSGLTFADGKDLSNQNINVNDYFVTNLDGETQLCLYPEDYSGDNNKGFEAFTRNDYGFIIQASMYDTKNDRGLYGPIDQRAVESTYIVVKIHVDKIKKSRFSVAGENAKGTELAHWEDSTLPNDYLHDGEKMWGDNYPSILINETLGSKLESTSPDHHNPNIALKFFLQCVRRTLNDNYNDEVDSNDDIGQYSDFTKLVKNGRLKYKVTDVDNHLEFIEKIGNNGDIDSYFKLKDIPINYGSDAHFPHYDFERLVTDPVTGNQHTKNTYEFILSLELTSAREITARRTQESFICGRVNPLTGEEQGIPTLTCDYLVRPMDTINGLDTHIDLTDTSQLYYFKDENNKYVGPFSQIPMSFEQMHTTRQIEGNYEIVDGVRQLKHYNYAVLRILSGSNYVPFYPTNNALKNGKLIRRDKPLAPFDSADFPFAIQVRDGLDILRKCPQAYGISPSCEQGDYYTAHPANLKPLNNEKLEISKGKKTVSSIYASHNSIPSLDGNLVKRWVHKDLSGEIRNERETSATGALVASSEIGNARNQIGSFYPTYDIESTSNASVIGFVIENNNPLTQDMDIGVGLRVDYSATIWDTTIDGGNHEEDYVTNSNKHMWMPSNVRLHQKDDNGQYYAKAQVKLTNDSKTSRVYSFTVAAVTNLLATKQDMSQNPNMCDIGLRFNKKRQISIDQEGDSEYYGGDTGNFMPPTTTDASSIFHCDVSFNYINGYKAYQRYAYDGSCNRIVTLEYAQRNSGAGAWGDESVNIDFSGSTLTDSEKYNTRYLTVDQGDSAGTLLCCRSHFCVTVKPGKTVFEIDSLGSISGLEGDIKQT